MLRKTVVTAVTGKARAEVWARSKGYCEVGAEGCWGMASQLHHRKHRRHGDDSPGNLLAVCVPCHNWIHAHPSSSYERGWLIRGNGL